MVEAEKELRAAVDRLVADRKRNVEWGLPRDAGHPLPVAMTVDADVVRELLVELELARIDATRAQPKPLDWTPYAPGDRTVPYDHCRAWTPFGVFEITWKSWKVTRTYDVTFDNDYSDAVFSLSLSTLDEAKAAAQDEFRKRVLRCLVEIPVAAGGA